MCEEEQGEGQDGEQEKGEEQIVVCQDEKYYGDQGKVGECQLVDGDQCYWEYVDLGWFGMELNGYEYQVVLDGYKC